MRRDTMGIILTSNDRIPPITDIRANSALPIAGRYRIIDFVLSCMANSGITNIGVATEANYSSFDGITLNRVSLGTLTERIGDLIYFLQIWKRYHTGSIQG